MKWYWITCAIEINWLQKINYANYVSEQTETKDLSKRRTFNVRLKICKLVAANPINNPI